MRVMIALHLFLVIIIAHRCHQSRLCRSCRLIKTQTALNKVNNLFIKTFMDGIKELIIIIFYSVNWAIN